jgi:dTDP-4-amino-4,6-dideoxygalactose transaminase
MDFKKGNFPISEDYYNNCLSIPIFPGMKKNEVKYVIETINNLVRL